MQNFQQKKLELLSIETLMVFLKELQAYECVEYLSALNFWVPKLPEEQWGGVVLENLDQ